MTDYFSAIRGFEGFAPKAKWDYKQWTNGFGTRARYPGEVITEDEAERRYRAELDAARGQVKGFGVPMTPGQEWALTDLTYNAGPKWMQSGLGQAVKSGDWRQAADIFQNYNKAGGEILPGLSNRRRMGAAWMLGAPPSETATAQPGSMPMQRFLTSGQGYSNALMSPEAVARRRRDADAYAEEGTSIKPLQHWTQAAARALMGGASGYYDRKAEEGEKAGKADAYKRMTEALVGKASPTEAASSFLASPWTEDIGQKLAVSEITKGDPLQDYKTRAAAAEAQGLQRGTQEWKQFVLTGDMSVATPKADTPEARAIAAQQYGLDPKSDAGRAYILTGRLPREDQQMLTATDKKAILEADETVQNTEAAISGLERALDLSKKAYDGATANERAWLTSQWGNESGIATRELNQAVTQTALQQLKAIFGGNPTEGERKILLDIQGSAELPQQARESILAKAKELAINRLNFNRQRASELRGGTFYKPKDAAAATEGLLPQSATGEPVKINSDAEYEALPSGAKFIGPDGQLRQKP